MRLLWRNVLFGVLGFWLLLLVYMSLTLFHTNDRGEATDRTQRQLNDALRQLDDLKQENKKLYVLAKQLQREMSQNKQPRLNSSSSHSSSAHDLAPLVDLAEGHSLAPSQTHEVLQRAVENGVREQWYYMRSQLGKLRKDISAKTSSVESWLNTLDDVINTGADYRRALLRDLHNLTSLSGDWRKQESEELSKIVQERIYHTQNPKDCSTARKLVCNLNKGCGYGCQLHHVVYCFLVAHGTGRTMILESNNWRYSSGGWEKYFLPVSDTCTDKSGSISKAWGR